MTNIQLTPRLIVAGADRAITFYQRALGAELIERFADRGRVVHAALRIGGAVFSLAEEHSEWNNHAPSSLAGSTVILELGVADADAVASALTAAGAEVVFPLADRFYGKREGRFRDPFGHLWIVSQTLETLTAEEIERRMRQL